MTLGSAVKVLLRRWLVILIGLLLTLGAAGYLYLNTPPRYQATARMLLLLPADARGEEAVGSPFLYLPNGLNVLARIVATTPNSQDFHAQMVDRGLTSQYELGVDPTSPTLTVSVEGADPENVIETRDAVIATMQAELLRVQQEESAPTNQIARGRVYAAESTPEQISGDRMRGVLAVGGAGALLTLLMAFLIDRLIVLRKARKKRLAENPVPRRPSEPRRRSTAPRKLRTVRTPRVRRESISPPRSRTRHFQTTTTSRTRTKTSRAQPTRIGGHPQARSDLSPKPSPRPKTGRPRRVPRASSLKPSRPANWTR